MARSFSQQARQGALLLPQIRAIGDLDEGEPPFDLDALGLDLPPAVSSLRRRFELARLITRHYAGLEGRDVSAKLALELADSLAGFFDSLALEEVDAEDRLESLVSGAGQDQYTLEGWAEHWQVSARFLNVAVREWPKRLAELDLLDPSQRQVILIRRLVDQWTDHPPQVPLILAGSTGSAPSMADLMHAVAIAPLGAVVLPGLDLHLAEDVWRQIEDSHPQGTMKRTLDRHGVSRDQIHLWPASVEADRKGDARRRLLNEALRPAEATKDWLSQIATLKAEDGDPFRDGLDGLIEINTARDEEAASVIALLMREAIERPKDVVALITPDIALSRRVAARLSRWGLQPDNSAGEPLPNTLTGRFLLDIMGLMETPHDPVLLLSLFNHPYCRLAGRPGLFALETRALRGATPTGLDMISTAIASEPSAVDLWTDYLDVIRPALATPVTDLGQAIAGIVGLAESLALEDGAVLWQGAPGAQASEMLAELIRESAGFPVSGAREVRDILSHLIALSKVRTGGNTHPRLLILGAIEARLVKADRLILAGLEEGVWPQAPDLDPFLSRPMRERLGLPSPERRTGLSAHDFVQAAAAPEVYLVTRHRREGEPQVQSRWLWRLQTLCDGAEVKIPERPQVLDWARAIDCGLKAKPPTLKPATRPAPKPPVAVRPMQMPVTQVEVFVRDPYAIYARRILNLRPMDRPNEPVEARQRGTAIHKSLERFGKQDLLGEAGVKLLTTLLEDELLATNLSPAQMALQRPLLEGMAREFVTFETERRAGRPSLLIEQSGELRLDTSRGDFILTAKSDRIEVRDDAVDILDFKTGLPPSAKQVAAGFYPQLTLTAAILRHGGFSGIGDKLIGDLIYVRVAPDGTTQRSAIQKGETAFDLAEKALAGFRRRLDDYADPDKPYLSWTAPQFLKIRGGDYDQLARLYEWNVLGDDEAAEEEVEA
ncbi:PD-(D/E)XK nuclease family protein [Asticcacaulis sp. AC466]|uniref:PD-(D/E)XK nuclease family protein n=1 Tax=Asticcacaulis sp. AC466 TaxID=1282362 RepID=UPI000414E9C5